MEEPPQKPAGPVWGHLALDWVMDFHVRDEQLLHDIRGDADAGPKGSHGPTAGFHAARTVELAKTIGYYSARM